jgi:hypothetical protein
MLWMWVALAIVAAIIVAVVAYRFLQVESERRMASASRWNRRGAAWGGAPIPRRPVRHVDAAARKTAPIHVRPRPATDDGEDPYSVLVTMVLGDRAKADRLISLEQRKAPDLARTELIRNAIELMRQDLRR